MYTVWAHTLSSTERSRRHTRRVSGGILEYAHLVTLLHSDEVVGRLAATAVVEALSACVDVLTHKYTHITSARGLVEIVSQCHALTHGASVLRLTARICNTTVQVAQVYPCSPDPGISHAT
jgi:hypothetical protein